MEYTLNIKKYACRIYTSDIKEDVLEAFYDVLANDVDGLAEAIERFDPNLAQLLCTTIHEHKNRQILYDISENLEKYASYWEGELEIKDVHKDRGLIELSLPIMISLDCLEHCLEHIKENYEE